VPRGAHVRRPQAVEEVETAMLSYASGISSLPLHGETIGENLRRTVDDHGDAEALVVPHQGYRATYQQLWEQVSLVARGLIARGVARGDRVGIWAPNRYEWVIVQFATARIGAILVNINPAYRTTELEYALRQSGVSFLILARGFRQTDYLGMLAEVKGSCPDLRETLVLENRGLAGDSPASDGENRGLAGDSPAWETLLHDGEAVSEDALAVIEAGLQCDDPINIQYTSGTTGFPKGATLSHHNILNNGFFIGEGVGYTHEDRVCIPVPFYHCFGMVLGTLACTTHGACIVVPAEGFEAGTVLRVTEEERCTSLYGVPTMFIAELDHPDFDTTDFSRLRTGIMAGSPCPVEVMRKVQSRMNMREVTICYGMTETSPVSTQTALDDPLEKRVGTVGRVQPHIEVKIVDPETNRCVPRGEAGELCTRGYSVMLGYWANPEATAEAIDAAHWMHTGDLATMDDLGYVNIVGRIKDMIIRGGDNIYPREIEEFLYGHPDVSDVQVIGVPSERYGEEVMAWVRPRDGASITEEALVAFCSNRIASNKIPRYWKFVDAFPMTVTGKVQKYLMREASVEELGLQGAAAVRTA
jgi:fatty-acyl-CoA synthase